MTREEMAQKVIDFEEDKLSDEEVIDLFQHLVDSGVAWSLQGQYGRIAVSLIDAGYVKPAKS